MLQDAKNETTQFYLICGTIKLSRPSAPSAPHILTTNPLRLLNQLNIADWLLELYVLATSKVISQRVPICDTHGDVIVLAHWDIRQPDISLNHIILTLSQPVMPSPNECLHRKWQV